MARGSGEKEVDYFAILATLHQTQNARIFGQFGGYLAIPRSADVSASLGAGNVLLAVSDRRGIIRGWLRKPTHIWLKGFALKLRHDG